MLGFGAIAKKLFGTANDRKVKAALKIVDRVNALEPDIAALNDDELRAKTDEFRQRFQNGETLDSLLPEAYAVVREAAVRSLGMRHFDVQILGGIVLHEGNIAEMKTGEGKTLAATLPVYLNAITGRGVHVVTVNDYLARRDAAWMGAVYEFLGLSVGVIVPDMPDPERQAAYACDVTYATNNELGFDYLRDNLKYRLQDMSQRGYAYAIVDEVDSILIDEARTPLIISGPTEDQAHLYVSTNEIIPELAPEHYEVDEKNRTATLSEDGNEFVEGVLKDKGLLERDATMYDPESITIVHHVNQALKAHKLFQKDKEYIVRNGQVVIVDEFTGRMMPGRRFNDGLHQALEAKEGQQIQPENITIAQVTFQNYFRLYDKLAGMTGTALTEADEFMSIYGLDVIDIPTNMPITRKDEDDQVYRTRREKYAGIIEAIREGQSRGQPILVGTTSIEKSEFLSEQLKAIDVPHNVLNARYHEQEAMIIADAGMPGAVTIATNMAGRGTDIQLGGNPDLRAAREAEGVEDEAKIAEIVARIKAEVEVDRAKALEGGGLWVIATERHESRRIDNQLRGRSGRQGDPGRTSFFLSLEDDLMRIFGSERMDKMLQRLGLEEGEAIIHPWVNKAIERAQAKVEARNFDARKQILKFDDVMNDQRKAIFEQRREIMDAEDLSEIAADMRHSVIDDLVSQHIPEKAYADQWDSEGLADATAGIFGHRYPIADWAAEEGVDNEAIRERLMKETDERAAKKVAKYGPEIMRQVEKQVLLNTVDVRWREHLQTLEHLRSVIGLRAHAQRDPLNEYKSESFQLFENLLGRLRSDVTVQLMNIEIQTAPEQPAPPPTPKPAESPQTSAMASGNVDMSVDVAEAEPVVSSVDPNDPATWGKVGRNESCPCGSGSKYKHCHGRVT